MNDDSPSGPILVLIFGAPAVGKMTVGQALERLTGFRLFHVHQVVDLIMPYFPYSTAPGSSFRRLDVSYRRQFFEEAAHRGMRLITTAGWQFDLPSEAAAIRGYIEPFLDSEGQVYFVELIASLATRLARNRTENRRRHKLAGWSTEEALRRESAAHRYDSGGTLPFDLPFLRIDTEHLSAEATARQIQQHFRL